MMRGGGEVGRTQSRVNGARPVSDGQREAIIARARETFLRHERVEMNELAEHAGVNRNTLFRWFGGRDRILGEVIWSITEPTLDRCAQRAKGTGAVRIANVMGDFAAAANRGKDLIKTGGEWISSVELDNTVMSNPTVVEAVAIGVPDAKWDERPFVLAVVKDPAHADVGAQRAFLADLIPKWQIPERWAFVTEVPKTSVGKFDKKRIRDEYANGAYPVAYCPDVAAN